MTELLWSAFFSGISFGILTGLIFSLIFGVSKGINFGVIGGIFFGLAIGIFIYIQSKSPTAQIPLDEEETLIKSGPANHFVQFESVGGWLFLTSKRIVFKSHSFNVQNHIFELPLNSIFQALRTRSLYIVPNGLKIQTKQGTSESFVVNSRDKWLRLINERVELD